MKDALRSKLNVTLTAAMAFAAGLALASGLDLTPETRAAGVQSMPELQIGAPEALTERLQSMTFQDGFSEIATEMSRGVVTIEVERTFDRSARSPRIPAPFDDFFDRPGGGEDQQRVVPGTGSGFAISEDGYVVTNNHVVENAERVSVVLPDGRRFEEAEIVGRDPTTDVALLKIDASGLTPLPLGSSDESRVGDWVLAIGSPGFGGGGVLPSTVTAGIVSAKGRNLNIIGQRFQQQGLPNLAIEDFIQTDAVINRGNSGGPLVNARGEVVGMNTAIMSETGFYQGYGFAVPIELVREVVDDLLEYGQVRRPVIGVLIQEVTASDARYYGLDRIGGAKVNSFSGENSPARESGMRPGDVIIDVEGEPVESVSDLQRKIRSRDPGDEVELTVVHRDDLERETVTVVLDAADTPGQMGQQTASAEQVDDPLGIEVQELDAEARRRIEAQADAPLPSDLSGVVVTDADRQGAFARSVGSIGSLPIIVDIDGRDIQGLEDYNDAVSGLEPGDVISLQLYLPSLDTRSFVTVEIPGG